MTRFKKQHKADIGCLMCGGRVTIHDDYMVKKEVWLLSKLPYSHPLVFIQVHMECLEKVIGRKITKEDLVEAPINEKWL